MQGCTSYLYVYAKKANKKKRGKKKIECFAGNNIHTYRHYIKWERVGACRARQSSGSLCFRTWREERQSGEYMCVENGAVRRRPPPLGAETKSAGISDLYFSYPNLDRQYGLAAERGR
jgi:hypothetical protein